MYTVQFFINKFEAIPEERWNAYTQYDAGTDTRCALGHCAIRVKHRSGDGALTKEGLGLQKIFTTAGYGACSGNWITDVNNGRSKDYKQPTPKQRILAALYDIKAMQSKDIDAGSKTKTVYVAVPVTISEQAKELVMS